VNGHHVVFKIHYPIQNQTLSLAHGMRARYHMAKVLQMKILNMVLHVRNAFEGTSPLFVCIPIVPDTEDALSLAQDKGKLFGLRRGTRTWSGGERLFLKRILAGRD
jgi:hypothetical protein